MPCMPVMFVQDRVDTLKDETLRTHLTQLVASRLAEVKRRHNERSGRPSARPSMSRPFARTFLASTRWSTENRSSPRQCGHPQVPQVVAEVLVNHHTRDRANIHRGVHELSQRAARPTT